MVMLGTVLEKPRTFLQSLKGAKCKEELPIDLSKVIAEIGVDSDAERGSSADSEESNSPAPLSSPDRTLRRSKSLVVVDAGAEDDGAAVSDSSGFTFAQRPTPRTDLPRKALNRCLSLPDLSIRNDHRRMFNRTVGEELAKTPSTICLKTLEHECFLMDELFAELAF